MRAERHSCFPLEQQAMLGFGILILLGVSLENELHDGYTALPFRGTSLRLIGRRRTFDVACVPEWSFCVTQNGNFAIDRRGAPLRIVVNLVTNTLKTNRLLCRTMI